MHDIFHYSPFSPLQRSFLFFFHYQSIGISILWILKFSLSCELQFKTFFHEMYSMSFLQALDKFIKWVIRNYWIGKFSFIWNVKSKIQILLKSKFKCPILVKNAWMVSNICGLFWPIRWLSPLCRLCSVLTANCRVIDLNWRFYCFYM